MISFDIYSHLSKSPKMSNPSSVSLQLAEHEKFINEMTRRYDRDILEYREIKRFTDKRFYEYIREHITDLKPLDWISFTDEGANIYKNYREAASIDKGKPGWFVRQWVYDYPSTVKENIVPPSPQDTRIRPKSPSSGGIITGSNLTPFTFNATGTNFPEKHATHAGLSNASTVNLPDTSEIVYVPEDSKLGFLGKLKSFFR